MSVCVVSAMSVVCVVCECYFVYVCGVTKFVCEATKFLRGFDDRMCLCSLCEL